MNDKASFSAVEIANLWQKYKSTDSREIRNLLIENYLPLVHRVVEHLAFNLPSHIERDDLVSSGFFGLMDAIAKFKPEMKIKFETYAYNRIRGSILDYLRSKDWLSVSLRKQIKQYENIHTALEAKLRHTPTKNELAEAMGISLKSLYRIESNINSANFTPLESYLDMEYLASNDYCEPDERLNREYVREKLTEAIDTLSEKEKMVIGLYYSEDLTLKEISLILNVSEARVSQIHKKAIFRLRSCLASSKDDL